MKVHYISSDFIFDKIRRDHGFQETDKNRGDFLEWITECMRKINIYEIYNTKITDCSGDNDCPIEVKNYRAALPCDFVEMITCRKSDELNSLHYGTDDYFTAKEPISNGDMNFVWYSEFRIESDTIFTNFKEGFLELTYKAMPLDENDNPLIPDSQPIIDAITSFIAYKLAFKLSYSSDRYLRLKEELKDIYIGYIRSARAYCNTPSFKEALNIATMLRSMHTRTMEEDYNFKDLGASSR